MIIKQLDVFDHALEFIVLLNYSINVCDIQQVPIMERYFCITDNAACNSSTRLQSNSDKLSKVLIEVISRMHQCLFEVTSWGKSPLSICVFIKIFAALCNGARSLSS